MNRRALLAAPLSLGLVPLLGTLVRAAEPTAADQPLLDRLAAYLNAVHTLRARFEQVAPNGAVSTGTVWMDRPGRMRFQYDPPSPLLLVVNNGQVIFYDSQLKQVTRIPLDRTPLSILLSDHVSFGGPVKVTDLQVLPNEVQVSVVQRANPGEGLLAIVFVGKPLALYQWTVEDAQRKVTRVTLSNVQLNVPVTEDLFTFHPPAGAK